MARLFVQLSMQLLVGKMTHILCVDTHNNLYGDANFFNGAFASENSIAPRLELIPTPFDGFLAAGAGLYYPRQRR